MSAWTLASRPASRFLSLSALASVISAIVASSLLNSILSQTPGVRVRFAAGQGLQTGAGAPCESGREACLRWDTVSRTGLPLNEAGGHHVRQNPPAGHRPHLQ